MALLAQTDDETKTSGSNATVGRSAPARPLASIIKDGSRLMVTPALAERIIAECFYAPQEARDIGGEQHIRLLAAEIAAERFTAGTQIHFGAVGDKLYLLDGNHRIRAVIAAGKPVEFSILRDDVSSVAALGPLYWRHDFISRSRQMVLAGIVSGKGEGLGKTRMKAVMAALPVLATNFVRGPNNEVRNAMRSPDVRLASYRSWVKHAELYFDAVAGGLGKLGHRFNRTGVLAVGMATFKHQPIKAEEFWRTLAADDGLRQGDPRKTLLRHLTESIVSNKVGDGRVDSAVATAICWNAWFEGRSLTLVRSAATNFYIAGTPYARKFQRKGRA